MRSPASYTPKHLAAVLGDDAMRLQLLREAHQLYEQIGAPFQAQRIGHPHD